MNVFKIISASSYFILMHKTVLNSEFLELTLIAEKTN